jgi:hypothetical protein
VNLFTHLTALRRKDTAESPIGGGKSVDWYAGKLNELMREAMRDGVRPSDLISAMENEGGE